MTIVGLIKVVRQILVRGVLYSGLNKAYRLAFITVFNILDVSFSSSSSSISLILLISFSSGQDKAKWLFFPQLKYVTVAGSIKVVRQALVGGVLYGKLDKAYRLTFITIFSIRVIVAYLPTLAPIGMVDEF